MSENKQPTLKERQKDLNAYKRTYEKNVSGKGTNVIVGFGKDLPKDLLQMHTQPTGIISVDAKLGGGTPKGGIFTVAGGEGVGKSTFALRTIAAVQQQKEIVALIDAEHSFDKGWAIKNGVDVDSLFLVQGDTLEDTLNLAVDTLRNNLIDYAVLDSLDATIARQSMATKRGKAKDLDNDDIALKARQFSRFFPRILHSLRVNQASLMLIAQYRTSGIGGAYVNPFNISGGNARKFYDWMTIELRKASKSDWLIADDGSTIGFPLRFLISKSKMPGVREGTEFRTMFFNGKGFDNNYEKVKMAYDGGLIDRVNNANHIFEDISGKEHKIPFGKEIKVINYIIENNLIDLVWTKVTGEVVDENSNV